MYGKNYVYMHTCTCWSKIVIKFTSLPLHVGTFKFAQACCLALNNISLGYSYSELL